MAELSVQIGADIKDLQKKLNLAEKDLKGLEKVSSKSGSAISKVGDKASKGINKLNKSTANANPTLQEFSRVIQDAPFGIQGVGNNITQLTSQFGYLQKSAGGTIPALKTLASSFIGPAGILFAISSVVSILTVYGDELLKSSSATSGLAKATAKYVADAKTEITTLNQLLSIAKDEAQSKVVRQGAIDEINKKYSKYLGNLDLETVKTDAVATSVKNLTQALILKAKVSGLETLITERTADASEDIVEAEIKRNKALKLLNSEVNKAIKSNAFFNQIIGNVKGDRERLKAFIELTKRQDDVGAAARNSSAGISIALEAYKDASNEVKNLNGELDDSLLPLIKLQEQFRKGLLQTEGNVENIDDGAVIINAKKTSSEKEKIDKSYAERKRNIFDQIEAEQIKADDEAREAFIKKWENVEIKTDPFDGLYDKVNSGFQEIITDAQRLQELSTAVSTEVSNAFSGLANNVVNSLGLASSGFEGFVGGLIGTITKLISLMLAQSISQSIAGATASGTATGPAAIFTTPAFIAQAIGGVLAAFATIPKFATGGFSGDNNLAYLNKNELVLRPFEQAALFNALRGTGISNITNNTNTGGSNDLVGDVVLRGNNQVIQFRRAEKRMNRFYG